MKFGCSSFSWQTVDNKHLLGRTYDQFGNLDNNKIVVIPKNYTINLETNCNNKNTTKTKNASVGMSILGLKTPILVDGINEKGLIGALLHYPEFAKYDTHKNKTALCINPGLFLTYALGEFSNIEELVSKMKDINLTSEPIFGKKIPVHYIFSDKSGETIIIEPDEDGIKIHRNTIGVLTNSPNYLWHKQNLRNYVGLTNGIRLPQKVVNYQISEFGEGLGTLGLPGDYSSVSRFVRMAFLKEFSGKALNEIDGITKMFDKFSSVVIPEGMITANEVEYYQTTLCTSAACSESLKYYFSVSTNRRISVINLEKEKNNTNIKFFDLPKEQDFSFLN